MSGSLKFLTSLCLMFFLWNCAGSIPHHTINGPYTFKGKTEHRIHGFRRTYRVFLPSGYDGRTKLPLVVVIHGAFDTAKGMEEITGFSDLAEKEGFICLYPNGMGILGFLQHWNAGHCCGKAQGDKLDDVGFIEQTITDVKRSLLVDEDRIYMVGFSNGGMMTYRFAAEKGHLLAAIAPLAASIGGRPSEDDPEWRIQDPVCPLPLLTIHGLLDNDIPYEGGLSLARKGSRSYWSVRRSLGFWAKRNECLPDPGKEKLFGEKVHFKLWNQCEKDTPIMLYALKGWGHVWPGQHFYDDLDDDDPLRKFDAATIVWEFFKKHHRLDALD